MSVQKLLQEAKAASAAMGRANSAAKNQALENIASELESSSQLIIAANQLDMTAAETNGVSLALQDRLRLDQARVSSLAIALRKIAQLEDPIGESVRGMTLANGLLVQQVRVPFGVIGCIYEARPNVTIDIAGLAIKSGNCAVLRGGSAAENTNKSLIGVIQAGLEKTGLPKSAVSTVDPFGRDGAVELMKANGLVDVLIPRGSASLIRAVVTESTVPVIETGDGVVHIFVDASADIATAIPIIINSKVQRPSVCNALETLLVHADAAQKLLPALAKELKENGVTVHGCQETLLQIPDAIPATDDDWATEYLSLDLAIRVVANLDFALSHIAEFSTKHTESILTSDA